MKTAILMVLAACGSNRLTLRPEPTTTYLVMPLIDGLNADLGCTAWTLESEPGRRVVAIKGDANKVTANMAERIGMYEDWTGTVYYEPPSAELKTTPKWSQLIILHELGHAMGLEHEADTAMSPFLLDFSLEAATQSLADLLTKHHASPCGEGMDTAARY